MGEHVQRILLPDETVLYEARVHPVIYAPGAALCLLAVALAKYTQAALSHASPPASPTLPAWLPLPYLEQVNLRIIDAFQTLLAWLPSGPLLAFLLAGGVLLWGVVMLARAYALGEYTELAVTDSRIIVKYGFAAVTMIEMDRFRIAEVMVYQTFNGRMMGYGTVHIRGFSGIISGLPPIKRPYEFQKALNQRLERMR